MDSLKSLMDKKDFDLVLSLTKGARDPEAIFYRATALISKNKPQEAMNLIRENRTALYEANPLLTLKADFELRFLLRQFDEAYKDLEYYSNQPYVSQAVEEQLRAYPSIIRSSERAASFTKNYDAEEVERILLTSHDDYEVLSMLNYVQIHDLGSYSKILRKIIASNRHPYVRTYALLLLIAVKDPEKVEFQKNGRFFQVVPAELDPPYVGDVYNGFCNNLILMAKDPSVSGTAHELLNDYIMDVYPEKVIVDKDDKILAAALIKLAREYLRSPIGIESYIETYHLKEKAVEALAKTIKGVLDETPTLLF